MRFEFHELNIGYQRRVKRKHGKTPMNIGIDTETYRGRVKLICDSFGRSLFLDESLSQEESFIKLVNFLTFYKYRKSFNWFFNIKYDFESIIKWLNYEQIKELYENHKINIGNYHLSYIPSKSFSIRVNENSYVFYDINNFLETSLNNASKNYLQEKKLDIIDSSRLNEDLNYWKENKENIIKYCVQDAILTKRVSDYFWNLINKTLNFRPNKPYSKGRFSEEYFMNKCYIPTINKIDKEVLEYAYKSYYGGRFELLKRGYFENVYAYDIKSAYPSEMINLIDINKGKWKKVTEFKDSAFYGFYHCLITYYHPVLSPFMQKFNHLNSYPNGIFEQYLTQQEIRFIQNYFSNNVKLEILDGWVYFPEYFFYPLKDEIEKLYTWKESEKDKDIKYCIKIVLNSLYGKFIQTVSGNTGKLFNPIWASVITANTRIKLLSFALSHPDKIISFSTDSLHSQIPLKIEWEKENGLGEFELQFIGKGIFLMSDIYSVWNDSDKKTRFRGFQISGLNTDEVREKDKHTVSLTEILKNLKDTKYSYTVKRPIHMGEALTHIKTKTIEDINIFQEITKEMDINGDKKRIWDNDFKSGEEALFSSINSKPLIIMME